MSTNIYPNFVFPDKLISPVNNYQCRRLTKQNINQFGFVTIQELHEQYPDFPLRCDSYHDLFMEKNNISIRETSARLVQERSDEYMKNPKYCGQCENVLSYEQINQKFCGSSCAATYNNKMRAPRSEESKNKTKMTMINRLKLSNPSYEYVSPNERRRKRRLNPQLVVKCRICDTNFVPGNGNRKICSDECRKKLYSETAKNNSSMGGNKNTRAHGWYVSPYAGRVWLESSYEYKVACILDEHEIEWIRPKYLHWTDENGKFRKYFADFYLPKYDVYLDPKNDYLIEIDKAKIECVIRTHSVVLFVLTKSDLTYETIRALLDGAPTR